MLARDASLQHLRDRARDRFTDPGDLFECRRVLEFRQASAEGLERTRRIGVSALNSCSVSGAQTKSTPLRLVKP